MTRIIEQVIFLPKIVRYRQIEQHELLFLMLRLIYIMLYQLQGTSQ
jgi:hypothetical protein